MSVSLPVAEVCEPKPAVLELPAPAPPAAPAPAPAVYWGDRLAVRLWFAGAGILALLHVIEWLYQALRR